MDDSDDQGFHQATLEFMTVKIKNQGFSPRKPGIIKLPFNREPSSLHHELRLYQYSKEIEKFSAPQISRIAPQNDDRLERIKQPQDTQVLLSQYFPRKMCCVYNRFRENLTLKRDMTQLIRNLSRRVCNDQLTKFQVLPKPIHKHGLSFSADFQGGNLHCAFRCKKTGYYYLFLQDDVNTHGYNIWFHFNITAAQNVKQKFVIVNMTRPIRFQQQLCLLTCSSASKGYERKVGFNCVESCYKNRESHKPYYSLSFDYNFKEGQTVYFSPIPPYSYSKLMNLLEQIDINYRHTNLIIDAAAKSQIGNTIPFLKISSKERPSKHIIVITARQHPCETVGSFICQHIIKLLLSESQGAMQILRKYSFVIIPMINVDGAIHGNSRTNLLGYDLNRSWEPTFPFKSIECHLLWQFLMRVNQENDEIRWLFDLHGHSKQLGYMGYFAQLNQQTQIYHYLNQLKSPLYVKNRCIFGIGGNKIDSLRGQFYERLKVKNSVTIQTSYYGFKNSLGVFQHWQDRHFGIIAQNILDTLVQTQKTMHNRHLKQQILAQISRIPVPRIIKSSGTKINKDLDSDSDPEQGYLKNEERQELHLMKARQKITNIKQQKKQEDNQNKKSYLLTELSETKYVTQAAVMSRKPPKKEKLNKTTKRSIRTQLQNTTNNYSFIQPQKRKERSENTRQLKFLNNNKRKIFSEHKYVINDNNFEQLKAAEIAKKTYVRKKSLRGVTNQTVQTLRAKTQFSRSRLDSQKIEQTQEQASRLHTIVYPTSSFAGYSLNTQFRAIRAKIMGMKGTSSANSRRLLLNSFNQSFYSKSSKQFK